MHQMTHALSLFRFQDHEIRVAVREGEPWFVAKDVCEALGIVNHKDAISRLPEHQKDGVGITDPIGREQLTTIISEAAMYKLAFRSNKKEAEAFTDWVASDVLPAIRKTGSYSLSQEQQIVLQELPLPTTCATSLLKS
jgi:prophage antirepressor-like protein